MGKATAKNPYYLHISLMGKYEKITILCSCARKLCTISIYLTASETSSSQYLANSTTYQAPISL